MRGHYHNFLALARLIIPVLCLLVYAGGTSACHKQVLRPGAINLTEQGIHDSLRVTQAAIEDAKTRVAQFPELKAVLNNQVIPSYNKAEVAGKAYRTALEKGSPPDQSKEQAIISQITAVNAALAALLQKIGVGK